MNRAPPDFPDQLPVVFVSEPEQLKAFSHRTRLCLLELMIPKAMTAKQLGDALDMSAAQAHYHLKFLEKAGLVRQVYQLEKASVIEKYYRAVSRKFIVHRSIGTFQEPGAVIMESLAAAMMRGAVSVDKPGEVGLVFGGTERVRLGPERARELLRIATMLQDVQEELTALGETAPGDNDADSQAFELTFGLYAASDDDGASDV